MLSQRRIFKFSFTKYLFVGVINTFFGLVVIFAAKLLLDMGDIYANLSGYGCGILLSYALNSRWTFNYTGSHLWAFYKFLLITIIAYFVNLFVVMTAINDIGLNSYISQALGVPPYVIISFLMSKYLVFKNTDYNSQNT